MTTEGVGELAPEAPPARPDRRALLCFTPEAETEQALRDGLGAALGAGMEVVRGDVRRAITMLGAMPAPLSLVVDVSGHPQPLAALEDLACLVEPDVRMLVIGDRQDLGFYRHLTRGLGVADYLYKPVTAAMVAENFAPVVLRRQAGPRARGGRLIAVTGARGGVGASTVAVSLAWHLAHRAQRHTVLLDADLHRGTVPLLLNIPAGAGLRTALSHPERVDELFVERSALVASERLHALAAEDAPGADAPPYREGACGHLVSVLRRRYGLIVADAPFVPHPIFTDVMEAAQQRVVVIEPTLAGVRDALRLLALPAGTGEAHRPILLLNRHDRRGALSRAQVSEAMRREPDILLPDLPGPVERAASLGEPAARSVAAFARGINELAQAAAGVDPPEPRRGGLRRWFGR